MPQNDRNAEMVGLLETDFVGRNEPNYAWRSAVSQLLALPGLRAAWPMSAVTYLNRAKDVANGNDVYKVGGGLTYGYEGLVPYANFTGAANSYLRRADGGAGNWGDILGTESYIVGAYRGLTLGGWFYIEGLGNNEVLMAKWEDAGNQRSYLLRKENGTGFGRMYVSTTGADFPSVTGTIAMNTNSWNFVVGRADNTSKDLDIFVNNNNDTSAAAYAAAINDSTADFTIGARNPAAPVEYLTGKASLCFLCAASLSDTIIQAIFENQRAMFNV